jgi:hypothetical protein
MPLEPGAVIAKCSENQDLHPSPDFWTALILSAYQSYDDTDDFGNNASSGDLDPDYWYHIHGAHPNHTSWEVGDLKAVSAVTPIFTGAVPNCTIVYQQTLNDYIAQLGICMHVFAGHWRSQTHSFAEARIIAHEIAHQFGIEGHITASLVDEWTGSDDDFFAEQIAYIRSSTAIGDE